MTEEVAAACSALMRCSDDVLIALFARAPLASRRAICASSRRLHAIVNSAGFVEERRPFAESVLVVAGGFRSELLHASDDCWMLRGERWRRTARLLDARTWACATVFEARYGSSEATTTGTRRAAVRTSFRAADTASGTFVAALDCRTGEWRRRPPLAERRTNAVCGVVGGRLWSREARTTTPAGSARRSRRSRPTARATAAGLRGCLSLRGRAGDRVRRGRGPVRAGGADSDALQVFDGAAWSPRARPPARRFARPARPATGS